MPACICKIQPTRPATLSEWHPFRIARHEPDSADKT